MPDTLAGTGPLTRLALRRDRVLVPLWVLGMSGMAALSASATVGLYPTEEERLAAAEALNSSAAIVALYGRVYDPLSIGALSMIKLTAFGAAIIGILALFLVIRHTRAEEEPGRLELLTGGRLGRDAPLTAALILAGCTSLLIGLLTTIANTAAGLPFTGSLAFGAGWAATGVVYAAIGAVVAQVTSNARTARGLGLLVIAVTYALRAVGDLAEPGPSWLSWLSPIGWNQQLRAYAGDRWWVLVLPVVASIALVAVAYRLRAARDLGAGLRADRQGPARGSLASVGALAWRLQSRALVAWATAFVVFGALLGSLASTVDDLITSPEMKELFDRLGGSGVLVDGFLGAEVAIIGAIAAAYGISAADRLRSEEADGRLEPLLATPTTRVRWAASHYVIALSGVLALMLLVGLALGAAASQSLGDWGQLPRIVGSALGQVPAAWLLTSIVLLLFGWLPRATGAAWALLVAFFALGEFGSLWGAPEWVMNLSALHWSPRIPVVADDAVPLLALLAVAVLLSLAGLAGWRRRDTPA